MVRTSSSTPTVGGLRAWISPSFALLIFLWLPATVLVRPDTMLTDPGIGWHLKTGEYILSTGSVPQHDLFSFTLPGAPWTTYEWLFQVLAAVLTGYGGLPLLTAVSTLIYASLPVLLYQKIVRETSNVPVAAFLAIASAVLFAAHAHARPHIVTYILFFVLADQLARYERGEVPAGRLFWFIPATTLWANLHGGFVAGVVLVGLYACGAIIKSLMGRPVRAGSLRIYGGLGVGMVTASLLNPAGWNLHLAILDYLSSDSLALMVEYQSPDFSSGVLFVVVFEALILGLLLLFSARRASLDLTECLVLVFFLHHSLTAIRHVFLFALVALPIVAREITAVLGGGSPGIDRAFRNVTSRQFALRSDAVFFPLVAICFLGLSLTSHQLFRVDLDDIHLTRGAAEFIEGERDQLGRMFNSSALGGALVYRFWPDAKVFGDDRNDFYGDDFVINKYYRIISARADWQEILDEFDVTSAVVLRDEVAAELFRTSPDWSLAYRDEKNEVFTRAH